MRIIDADLLECDTEWSEYEDGFTAYSRTQIECAPSIDAVSVVRCKECRHWDNTDNAERCSHEYGGMWAKPDDFCSYGQKGDKNVETD